MGEKQACEMFVLRLKQLVMSHDLSLKGLPAIQTLSKHLTPSSSFNLTEAVGTFENFEQEIEKQSWCQLREGLCLVQLSFVNMLQPCQTLMEKVRRPQTQGRRSGLSLSPEKLP